MFILIEEGEKVNNDVYFICNLEVRRTFFLNEKFVNSRDIRDYSCHHPLLIDYFSTIYFALTSGNKSWIFAGVVIELINTLG